jgi:hypothetical protein
MSIPAHNRSPDRQLLVRGEFGAAVARCLQRWTSVSCHPLPYPEQNVDLTGVSPARDVAVASSHWPQSELEVLDRWARVHGTRWNAVFMHDHHIIGLGGGAGGRTCVSCVWRRFLVHAAMPKVERALQDHLRSPGRGAPRGFPPGAAGLAAAYLLDTLDAVAIQAGPVITRIDLLSGNREQTAVVPLHGCEACRPSQAEKSHRFVRHLTAALGHCEPVELDIPQSGRPSDWRASA